jgi:hypothetical protein
MCHNTLHFPKVFKAAMLQSLRLDANHIQGGLIWGALSPKDGRSFKIDEFHAQACAVFDSVL